MGMYPCLYGGGGGTGGYDLIAMESQTTFDITDQNCPTQSTVIPNRMFNGNQRIREVSLSNIETIEEYAFYQSNATSFNFPNCTSVGAYAFYQCRGASSIPFNMPKVTEFSAESVRGAYVWSASNYKLEQGTFNGSKPVGSTYESMKTSNTQRGRFCDLYPVTEGMKLKWDTNSIYTVYICYFDSDKLYNGVHSSSWESSGEITISKSDGDYIAVSIRKSASPYYIYSDDYEYINVRICINDTVVADFRTRLELPECVTIGDNAFRDAASNSFYLPKCEHLGNTWGWNSCRNHDLVLPSIKTMGTQPFRGVTFTNLVLGPNWTSCGSGFAGYDADWRGGYVYIYAVTPPTMGGGLSIRNNPNAIYVPADSVADYQAANQWSTYASVIQALPSGYEDISVWL